MKSTTETDIMYSKYVEIHGTIYQYNINDPHLNRTINIHKLISLAFKWKDNP